MTVLKNAPPLGASSLLPETNLDVNKPTARNRVTK